MVPQKVPQSNNLCGTFNQRLRRLMDAAQISKQVDLARILGVSPQTVSKAIKKQSIPFTWYKAISEKSGVPLEELTGVAPGVLEQFKRTGEALETLTAVAGQFLDSGSKRQATEQVCRMIRVLKGDSVEDLSHFLGVEPSDINQAISRGYIPDEWTDELSKTLGVSRDKLVFGYEKFPDNAPSKTHRTPTESPPPIKKTPNNDERIAEEKALDLSVAEFKDLWDEYWGEKEARRGWLQVEVIKRFPEFLEWLKNRPAPLRLPHPATLKKDDQTFHMRLPNDPPAD